MAGLRYRDPTKSCLSHSFRFPRLWTQHQEVMPKSCLWSSPIVSASVKIALYYRFYGVFMICMCFRYVHHLFSLRKSILFHLSNSQQFRACASPGKSNSPCPRTGDASIAASCTASMLCFIPLRPPPLAASTGTQRREFELQNFALQFSILAFQLIRPWLKQCQEWHDSNAHVWVIDDNSTSQNAKNHQGCTDLHHNFCLASLGTLRNLVGQTPPTLPSCSKAAEAWKTPNCKEN